jgi:predicted HTH transcriptional regulator
LKELLNLVKKKKVKYEYLDTGLGFRFTFYRKNVHGHVQLKITENDKIIIERLKDNPSMTIAELAKVLNVSDKTVYCALSKLKVMGIVVRGGNDKDGYWEILGK